MVEWYELEESDRVKKVYSKFKINDFWNWWSDGQPLWMEVRTTDWKVAQQLGVSLGLYYSHTGVFVRSANQLKKVIAHCRDKLTIWFGAQPRKWSYNKWGKRAISGGDNFIDSIKFIFVDIDRKTKAHPATNEELKNCDIVADAILKRFALNNWHKSYIKICSGNGVQLLIKLDFPIKVPEVKYEKLDDGNYAYIPNAEFTKAKMIIQETIGKSMRKYINKFKRENEIINVEIDKAAFRMAQVAALPVTKNFKFNGYRWRGVVNLKNGKNEGLSDYILEMGEKVVSREPSNIFGYTKKRLDSKKRLITGKLKENSLVQLMLNENLPAGERNNYLWFQLKCLIRDNKIDMNSKEFRKLHKELEEKNGKLTLNLPDKKFNFNENIVNKYCIRHGVIPIYELYTYRQLEFDGGPDFKEQLKQLKLESGDITEKEFELVDEDIESNMKVCQEKMIERKTPYNMDIINSFIKACRKRYGDNYTLFCIKNLFVPFFTTKEQ